MLGLQNQRHRVTFGPFNRMPLDPKTNAAEAQAKARAAIPKPPPLDPKFPYLAIPFPAGVFGVTADPPKKVV